MKQIFFMILNSLIILIMNFHLLFLSFWYARSSLVFIGYLLAFNLFYLFINPITSVIWCFTVRCQSCVPPLWPWLNWMIRVYNLRDFCNVFFYRKIYYFYFNCSLFVSKVIERISILKFQIDQICLSIETNKTFLIILWLRLGIVDSSQKLE